MYNSILRKVTSLSILAILLGSTFAMVLPNAMPSAHAQVASHPNLFVSAENSQYNNYFAGPQVIQVIVSDPNINRLDQAYGMPVVTVNGQRLEMVQNTDGNWYGYFADSKQAQFATAVATNNGAIAGGVGLSFGWFCSPTSAAAAIGGNLNFGLTKGVAFANKPGGAPTQGSQSPSALVGAACVLAGDPGQTGIATDGHANSAEHVLLQNKTLTAANGAVTYGQVGIKDSNLWPFVQLFDFSSIPTPVTVDYSAAGGDQIVNLTFDRIPQNLISVTPDRTAYPDNAAVLLTMNDPQLNVDPTEENSWTWGANTNNNTLFYRAFDRNGNPDADGSVGMVNLLPYLSTMMFNHNGKFTVVPNATGPQVIDFQSNGKQILNGTGNTATSNSIRGSPFNVRTASIGLGSEPITFFETGGVNSGVFGTWDGGHKSSIVMLSPAEQSALGTSIRGQSANYRYNDIGGSIVGGYTFGTITMTATNNTWSSGQRIPVTLTDENQNLNSKITEHINDYDQARTRIPTMVVGTPFTIDGLSPTMSMLFATAPTVTVYPNGTHTFNFAGVSTASDPNIAVDESFSHRALLTWQNSTHPITIHDSGGFIVDTNTQASALFQSIYNSNSTAGATTRFHGFNFLNFDLRSFSSLNGATGTDPSAVDVYLVYNTTGSLVTSISNHLSTGAHAISLVNGSALENFVNLNDTAADNTLAANVNQNLNNTGKVISGKAFDNAVFSIPKTADVGFMYVFTVPNSGETVLPLSDVKDSTGNTETIGTPVVTDFFSIGILGDGTQNSQRINNAIYRWELEETGDNTGVFTGTTQFTMLNQVDFLNPNTYAALRTINHDVFFAAIQDMLASEARAPQITYLDLGADGVNTQVSAQQDIPTNSGTVSFDQKTYKIGDTVTITVNDPDLNTNNDLVVIYTTVAPALNPSGSIKQSGQDIATDAVGIAGVGTYSDGTSIGRLLDVQWGQQDIRWNNEPIPGVAGTGSCFTNSTGAAIFSHTGTPGGFDTDLAATGFSLVETAAGSGIFTGTFEVPDHVCENGQQVVSNGQNIKVNYVDFRDESGKLVEVSDNAGIRGNTGSVKLDRAVYPVPFGTVGLSTGTANFDPTTAVKSDASLNGVFPLHRDLSGNGLIKTDPVSNQNVVLALPAGPVIVHARVNDPDYTTAATGTNFISVGVWYSNTHTNVFNGPVAFQITRGEDSVLLATAGGPSKHTGHIVDLGGIQLPPQNDSAFGQVPDLGPMTEISPGAGIFQADLPIELTDGPPATGAEPACPAVNNWDALNGSSGFVPNVKARFDFPVTTAHQETGFAVTSLSSPATTLQTQYCVEQGDILTVTYFDTSNAAGQTDTVTDSATFDERNGVLQSDKSVYIIGSDMILTLVEPDFDLDSQTALTYPLDLVEWDSHAYKGTMGPLGNDFTDSSHTLNAAFDAKPSTFVETGKDTGVFQDVIKIPKQLGTTLLERGEQINLEYTDWSPAGAKTVGSNSQDIELTIYTSNFGATVELDQKVYTWTSRVYITVVAPDHNFDPNLIDVIGQTSEDQVIVSTRGHQIFYKLAETGVDTGIFTGYVILTGDPTLKGTGGVDGEGTEPTGILGNGQSSCPQNTPCGPTDGFLPSEDQDGVSVSFEFTRDQTVTGSALIRWNIGEISWLQPSYPANGQGVLQIVDPDMSLNPKQVNKFDTNVWSDSDSGGIKLTMVETGQGTGIFQGTVYFTTNFQSSGNRLHVSQGDTVTGEYVDRTLPPPYTPADQLRLTATTFIGTIVPPLERAPASNPRIVDSFGNAINGTVKVGQQIQVTADLANGQNTDQPFAYLVQIQDQNGVTVSLSWITGTLSAGQSLNPAQSWTPSAAGTYTAQIFVWQSISNPNALSPPLSTTITVQ